ncbi:MAG: hypothetical protein FJ125_03445, partial [Deltaproteobacteria bacterium]|nr:hypothetical protein [Deltaproteobacteria bacterium]
MLSSLLVLLLLGSCGSSDKAVAAKQGPPRASWGHAKSFDDRGTSVEEYDIDGNGRMDYRVISRVKGDPSTRIRVEWDINHDGSIDLWQFFDRSGQLSQEEYDLDWDGKVDVIQFYEDGRITRKEVAT